MAQGVKWVPGARKFALGNKELVDTQRVGRQEGRGVCVGCCRRCQGMDLQEQKGAKMRSKVPVNVPSGTGECEQVVHMGNCWGK